MSANKNFSEETFDLFFKPQYTANSLDEKDIKNSCKNLCELINEICEISTQDWDNIPFIITESMEYSVEKIQFFLAKRGIKLIFISKEEFTPSEYMVNRLYFEAIYCKTIKELKSILHAIHCVYKIGENENCKPKTYYKYKLGYID